jgi:AraC family transcriptional regulator
VRAEHWIDYEERFDVVLAHVHEHLAEPLDLVVLAQVAGLSPRHFHRVFSSAFDETLAALVRRLRMQRGSDLLANSTTPVAEVAAQCGYPDVSSFTRAFTAAHGVPPARYRAVGTHEGFRRATVARDPGAFDVEIRAIDPIACLSVRHRGAYLDIDQAFADLAVWYSAHGHDRATQRHLGVFLSDPTSTATEDLRSRACFERPDELPWGEVRPLADGAAELDEYVIEGGTCAVLTHQGPYSDMPAKYSWLFGCWVPHAGVSLADRPVVEQYLDLPAGMAPDQITTEMWLPIEGG